MTDARVVDLSNWQPDVSYDEGLQICKGLGLIELVQHGEHDYGRLTQTGINVFMTLMQMAGNASFPENMLKTS